MSDSTGITSTDSENLTLPIAVDVMGGDLGPGVVVEGAVRAARELNLQSVIVGPEEQLMGMVSSFGGDDLLGDLLAIKNATQVIAMDESPSVAIRRKPDSSIRVAFDLVKSNQASAVVSPGNTGAMMAAGLVASGTLPGIARPAIASCIPRSRDTRPTVLLDSGANVDSHAQQLIQFALMGASYAELVIPMKNPKIGLLSNGSEASKGNDIIRSAAHMLDNMPELNFIGYVEGRDIPSDVADVIVCDGFLGNIVLKTMEGAISLVFDSLRGLVEEDNGLRSKLGMSLVKPIFSKLFVTKLDPSWYGGAPLLGLNHVAIVCHGASNSRAMFNAIRVADTLNQSHLIDRLKSKLEDLDSELMGAYEDGIWNRMGQSFGKTARSKAEKAEPDETGESKK